MLTKSGSTLSEKLPRFRKILSISILMNIISAINSSANFKLATHSNSSIDESSLMKALQTKDLNHTHKTNESLLQESNVLDPTYFGVNSYQVDPNFNQQLQYNPLGAFYSLENEQPMQNGPPNFNAGVPHYRYQPIPQQQSQDPMKPIFLHSSNYELAESPLQTFPPQHPNLEPQRANTIPKFNQLKAITQTTEGNWQQNVPNAFSKQIQFPSEQLRVTKPSHPFRDLSRPKYKQKIESLQPQPQLQMQPAPQSYRQSIGMRQKAVNLSSLLQPGEVILSERGNSTTQPNLSSVSVNEIEDLLRRLKPLAASSGSTMSNRINLTKSAISKDSDSDNEFESDSLDPDEYEELRDRNKLDRVLPTSHLFGGSTGLVSENRLTNHKVPNNDGTSNEQNSDEMAFITSLAALGSHLGNKAPSLPVADQSFYQPDSYYNSASPSNTVNTSPNESDVTHSIPIELLVDHLMSSSRKATFGVQHEDVNPTSSPFGENQETGLQDDDEEDDDDYIEDDYDGGVPPPVEEASESQVIHIKTNAPTARINFSSVAEKSDSWIPLDSVIKSRETEAEDKRQPKRRRRRRRRRRRNDRKSRQNNETTLVIGGKRLNRKDLVMLISVVSKMASKKEASKERDASRKLLRYLVGVALENHKKNQKDDIRQRDELRDNNSVDQNKIRQSLRSVLNVPEKESFPSYVPGNDTVSRLKTLRHKAMEIDEQDDGDPEPKEPFAHEDEEARGKKKENKKPVKSLTDISDDLEKYFDGEFFEDMADNMNSSSSSKLKKDSENGKNERKPVATKPVIYALPVPIYGQRHIEAADEDDTELDHVRLPQRKLHIQKRRRRRPRRRRKPPQPEDSSDKGDEPEESHPPRTRRRKVETDVNEKDYDYYGDGYTETEKDRKPAQTVQQKRRSGKSRGPPKADEPEDYKGQEEEQPEQSYDVDYVGPEEKTKEGNDKEKRSSNKSEHRLENDDDETSNDRPQRRRRRRRRPKTSQRERLKVIDIDRDEIPAPIIASKSTNIVRSSINKNSTTHPAKETKTYRMNKPGSQGRSTQGLTKRHPESFDRKRPDKSTKLRSNNPARNNQFTNRKSSAKSTVIPKEDKKDFEVGHFSEGTSYDGVCDEDQGCKMTLKSNNPKLGNAIKSQDEKKIVKHLDKWIRDDPD